MEKIIEARNIVKNYNGTVAVDGVDFDLHAGECFGLLGPNGAGKTSITKMVYNLVRRSSGSLSVFGQDPQVFEADVKAEIGVVPQEDNLDADLGARENLEIYANYFGISRKKSGPRISELFNFFELEGKEKYSIAALSGGMKRRLVIARALLNEPRLLLLDEPTTGLDPAARHLIWNKFRELKGRGMTILLTTHYMEEAAQLCDRLMILDSGKKIIEGNPARLMEENFERYVLETGCANALPEGKNVRSECHGGRQYVYSNDEKDLFALRELFGREQAILRNTTLEDLFLHLTGRSLNE